MDRVATVITTSPSAPPSSGPISARHAIAGQTQTGPSDKAVIVRSLAEYGAVFGARSGGSSMYDAAELAFRIGVSELVVARACGPAPVKATVSLDTGKIVVTAKTPGAYANSWTAAWTVATNTLTITAGSVVETYTGATSAALLAAAASSSRVTVTSSGTLPSSNVVATALASGTDDFANVVWTTPLGLLVPDLGPCSVAIPGLPYTTVGQILATHCAANRRHGLLSAPAGTNVAGLVSARATVAGYTSSDYVDLVGPWQVVGDGAGGTKTVDPTSFVAGLRANAQRTGIGESAAAFAYAKGVVDVTPEYPVSSTDWATLNAARVSTIRVVGGFTRLYTYVTAAPMGGNLNLGGAQYRDFVNAVTFNAEAILEDATNNAASPARLADAAARIAAMLDAYSGTYLFPRVAQNPDGSTGAQIDPGYRVQVSTGTAPADNRITAVMSLRLMEWIDFVDFTVAVGDATVNL